MKFRIRIIFLIICLIVCQNPKNDDGQKNESDLEISDSNETEGIKGKPLDPSKKLGYSIQIDDDEIKNIEIESIEFEEPPDLTDQEMDVLLLCAYLSQQALKTKYKEDVIKIAEKIGEVNTKKVYDKIGSEFTENCVNDIEQETVNKYITNLTYHNNFKWEKGFDNYTIIDYNKYNSTSDLKYTVEQQILLKFLKYSNEEFESRKRKRRNIKEPEKPKERKIEQNANKYFTNKESIIKQNIWKEIEFFISFIIVVLALLGIIYFLKKINSGKKDKNEKTKKKKVE